MSTHKHTIVRNATSTGAATVPDPVPFPDLSVYAKKADLATLLNPDPKVVGSMANVILRLAAVEAHFTPPPVVPPPGQKIVPFSGTAAQLVALMADMTVDVIEIAAGTYPKWSVIINVARPTSRPLLVRPAAGGAVIFDGTGMGGTPPFYVGWNSLASYITVDAAGTGGSFTIANYSIAAIGLVDAKYTDHVTFNGLIVRNCSGAPRTSHCLYVESDGTHRSKSFTANGWDVVGPSNRYLNGVQTFHSPSVDGLTLHGWTVSNLHRAGYIDADATGIDIDGWTIANCDATFDAAETAAGVIKNCHATNSGSTVFGSGYLTDRALVDGGGNTWS